LKRAKERKVDPFFVIRFSGVVDEENTSEFLALFDQARSRHKKIRIIINSGGGDPNCAFAIYDAVKRSGVCVETIAEGSVASAAVIIYLVGEKRLITPHSSIMVHKSRIGGFDSMTKEEVNLVSGRLANIDRISIDLICEKTGQPRRKVSGDIRRGRHIYAEEAIKDGYAHKII